LLLLHLLLVKEDLRLDVDGRVVHVFLIDVIVETIEDGLDPLEKLVEPAVLNLVDREEV
jgi:hypothetical protein